MKSLLAMILSSVPLAVLTAGSFVELAAVPARPAAPAVWPRWQDEAAAAARARTQVQADRPLREALSEADLFGQDPVSALQHAPAQSSLKSLADAWPQWLRAREVVGKVLQAEQLAAAADLEQLQQASRQMEDLQAQCQALLPTEAEPLSQLLDRRRAALRGKIAQRQRETEAAAVLASARSAYRPGQYGQCINLCDQLLSKYADAMDSSVHEKVRVLRWRAEFWGDVERLSQPRQPTDTPAGREALLRGFLEKYPRRAGQTEAEIRALEQFEKELRALRQQIAAAERDRAAAARIEQLERDLPAAFADRLARAAAILESSPAEAAKARLRDDARRWLDEFLPEKQLAEPPTLQEAETTRGEMVRGFFKEVNNPDGTLLGYKRYATFQQYLRPTSEVGTYRQEDLRRPPGESVLRQCLTRYHQARQKLREHPERQDAWQELADLCRALEDELRRYRGKPGSSTEQLSFGREEVFARQVIGGPAQEGLVRLFTM